MIAMAGVVDWRKMTYSRLYDIAIQRDKIRWRAVSFISAYASQSGVSPIKLNPYARGDI